MKEDVFWKNYFYRVSLIKQSARLTALAAQQAAECSEEKRAAAGPQHRHPQGTAALSSTVGQNAACSEKSMKFNVQCHLWGTSLCRAILGSSAIVEYKCNAILSEAIYCGCQILTNPFLFLRGSSATEESVFPSQPQTKQQQGKLAGVFALRW